MAVRAVAIAAEINLLLWRVMNPGENFLSRDRALFPEFADMPAYKFEKSESQRSVKPFFLIGPAGYRHSSSARDALQVLLVPFQPSLHRKGEGFRNLALLPFRVPL